MAGATQQQLMQVKSYTEQDKYLLYLVELGVKERYIDLLGEDEDYVHSVVKPKVMYELSVIIGKGFTDYFLILADLVQYCASKDIPVGVGRGSSAGSIVAYVLGITEVEPIRFNLIFDRFLNFERNDLPDIDTDVCWARRQEVIDYLVNKYGGDNVAQILTFGTLSPKTLIQDLCRVLKVGHKMVNKLKDAVPEDEKVGVEDCIENPEFMEVMKEANKEDGRLLPAFIKLGGLHRNTSIHAGGVIISTKPIRDLAPVYKPIAKSKANKVSRPVVQYEMQDAEAVGLLKMDLLGLRTVTLVDWAEKDVRRLVDPNFYTRKMSLEQKEAFDIINRGDTDGIFQLEGTGITKFAMDFQVQSFDELVALISLYRPGTLDSGMADSYIRRKRGQEQITYPHPDLEWVLKDTYGIMVYQEQIMQVAGVMCGYSMGQADGLRKAVGKKNKQKIEEELAKFKQYAMDPSRGTRAYDEELINQMADLIETFGRYGFNKSHAVSYAYLTYWTAYLKAVHPACFYTARLNTVNDDVKPMVLKSAIQHGVRISPPDINESTSRFTLNSDLEMRFGMSSIKGAGQAHVDKLLVDRDVNGGYSSFIDFCYRNPSLPVNVKKAMVQAGAFDTMASREELLFEIVDVNKYAKAQKEEKLKEIASLYAEKRARGEIDELTPLDMGQLEYETMGFYVTADPIDVINEAIQMRNGLVGIPASNMPVNSKQTIGGQVVNIHPHKTKKGDAMAFLAVDDGKVTHEVTLFPSTYSKIKTWLESGIYVAVGVEVGTFRNQNSLSATFVEQIDLDERSGDITIDLKKPDPILLKIVGGWLQSLPLGTSKVKVLFTDSDGYEYKTVHDRSVQLDRQAIDQIKSIVKVRFGR